MDARGVPTVCVPDPTSRDCIRPFHDAVLYNAGGPHSRVAALADIDEGKMDGFVGQQLLGGSFGPCRSPGADDPRCADAVAGMRRHDAMGYHTDAEIRATGRTRGNTCSTIHVPAQHVVEPARPPLHRERVGGQVPRARAHDVPVEHRPVLRRSGPALRLDDLTYLLHLSGVSWKYYLGEGKEPDCDQSAGTCVPVKMEPTVPSVWNPLPRFETVRDDRQLDDIVKVD